MARKSFTTTIDETVSKNFKEECLVRGDKMNEVLEAFMKAYIDGEFQLEVEFKLKRVKK